MTEETLILMSFKITPPLKAKLERRAREEHRSMSQHLNWLIERDEQPAPAVSPAPAVQSNQ